MITTITSSGRRGGGGGGVAIQPGSGGDCVVGPEVFGGHEAFTRPALRWPYGSAKTIVGMGRRRERDASASSEVFQLLSQQSFSFFFSRKVLDLHLAQKPSSRPKVSLLKFLRTSPLFKTTSNVSYPRERIKTRGYTFEFKSNFEFKWTPTHPLSTKGMRRGLNCAWSDFMKNLFSCNK